MLDLGHRALRCTAAKGSAVRILQVTDLHHFPKGCSEFDVSQEKGRIIPIGQDGKKTRPTPAPTQTCCLPLQKVRSASGYTSTGDVQLLSAILARVEPHLVVLTGDIVDGRAFRGRSGEGLGWRRCILEVLAPVVSSGCAWTFVPGNHDDDGGPWTREDLLGIFQLGEEAPGCISEGATSFDHTLTVGFSEDYCAETSLRLWLFDSGGNHEDPTMRYHTFRPSAVEGFERLSSLLPAAACELAYFHIPLPQAEGLNPVRGQNGLFDAALQAGMVPAPWRWRPFTSLVRLLGKDRIVGCSKLESGMFDAFVNQGRVRACFFGHSHQCDAVYRKDGIYMAFGRVGGTTPPIDWEGDAGMLPFEIGARLVQWEPSGRDLCTWIELLDRKEENSELLMA